MNDLISRQAAIDAIERNAYRHTYIDQIVDIINDLPSVQPDVPDTNVGELIRKQDAIDTSLEFFVEFLGGAFHENAQKELITRFQRLPSVQAREIECEKCYWSDEKGCSIFCRAWNRYTAHGGYCHQYADRRGDSDE